MPLQIKPPLSPISKGFPSTFSWNMQDWTDLKPEVSPPKRAVTAGTSGHCFHPHQHQVFLLVHAVTNLLQMRSIAEQDADDIWEGIVHKENEIKSKLVKMRLFNNRRWGKASKFFESGARKQNPNLEIQICFHLQLLALYYVVLKHPSELNKPLLLMWLVSRGTYGECPCCLWTTGELSLSSSA